LKDHEKTPISKNHPTCTWFLKDIHWTKRKLKLHCIFSSGKTSITHYCP